MLWPVAIILAVILNRRFSLSLRILYIPWYNYTALGALYFMESLNKQERSKVVSVLNVEYSPDDSRACRHQMDKTTPSASLGRMSAAWPYSNSTVFAGTGVTLCVLMGSWIPLRRILIAQNVLRYSVYFGRAITLSGNLVHSECLAGCEDSINYFTAMSELSARYLYGSTRYCVTVGCRKCGDGVRTITYRLCTKK
jgi:hypothetical protein